MKCNIWVYCPSEAGCFSPDKYEHKHQECWLKQRNSESRSKVKTLHTAGSRSFAAQFSIIQADDQQPTSSQADLYRERHYSKKQNKWITDHAKETHRTKNGGGTIAA